MRRVWLPILVLVLFVILPTFAHAQTVIVRGPVLPGAVAAWEMPANVPMAQATTFEARLSRGGTPLTAFTGFTCQQASGQVTCRATLTASNLDALNQVGVHELRLRLFRADVGESGDSAPFALTSPAGVPVNLRVESTP